MDDVEAIEQIFAELPLIDQMPQVTVGGGNDPDVGDGAGPLGPDLLQLARFQEAEEKTLHAQRHLADLVEEHGALVCQLELARLVAIGAGEAPLHMAEELRFEERFRQSGAVHRHELVVLTRPFSVDGAGDDFLADAALSGNQHLRIGAGHAQDFLTQVFDERARANE
jgi:hypothetical protein